MSPEEAKLIILIKELRSAQTACDWQKNNWEETWKVTYYENNKQELENYIDQFLLQNVSAAMNIIISKNENRISKTN